MAAMAATGFVMTGWRMSWLRKGANCKPHRRSDCSLCVGMKWLVSELFYPFGLQMIVSPKHLLEQDLTATLGR